ncbi:unnamed protein product [Prunus armeniaca]|uniref:Uncharacterized protein n=1 Tax=Prunus armeniaca TaxID=36596 RepID=A0A6J5WA21_PRUAR|nr:unnamed protein product [Prunus armeniaca]
MPMIDLGEEEGDEGCEREEVKVARREELKKKAIWDKPRCPSSRPCGPRALELEWLKFTLHEFLGNEYCQKLSVDAEK